MPFDYEFVMQMTGALSRLRDATAGYFEREGDEPAPASQADKERVSHPRAQSIVSAWSIHRLLLEYGAEHLTAFVKTATNPVEVIACFTCVRSMLEPCAIAAWMVDPSIDGHSRVGRVFAYRYAGMDKQLTFLRTYGASAAEIQQCRDRIDSVEQEALSLGFPKIQKGIGQRMEGATKIIHNVLGEDEAKSYRMLSAMAHGHHWAISQLSFKPAAVSMPFGATAARGLAKTDDCAGFVFLGLRVFRSFVIPLWQHCRYFGWNALKLEEILERAADEMRFAESSRFWRS